ncbi:DUF1173 family protein [Castellaniella sp. UC4442_H9]
MGQIVSPVMITLAQESRRFSPEFQRDPSNADAWKSTLLHAHGQAVVRCCCLGDDRPRRLSIRYRADSDTLYLARFPRTGHEHDPECTFYSPDPASSGLAGYRPGVVEELDDGGLKIKLKVGLQHRAAPEKKVSRSPQAAPSQPGKPAMTLLGLLHLLWTTADLNRWSPGMAGKRNLGLISYHLSVAARKIKAGHTPLSTALLLATPQAGGKQDAGNAERTAAAAQRDRRLVAIAPLARYKPEFEGALERPPIAGFYGFPYLILDPNLWEEVRDQLGAVLAAWREGERVIAIMQLDVPKHQTGGRYLAEVFGIALMRVTGDWIPVESGYEAQACDALVQARRRFAKPLRYDTDDATFPGFWLQDVGRAYPMEVWGMSTPEYLERKAQKAAHYDQIHGPQPAGWWSWDAAEGEPMPEFPQRRSDHAT